MAALRTGSACETQGRCVCELPITHSWIMRVPSSSTVLSSSPIPQQTGRGGKKEVRGKLTSSSLLVVFYLPPFLHGSSEVVWPSISCLLLCASSVKSAACLRERLFARETFYLLQESALLSSLSLSLYRLIFRPELITLSNFHEGDLVQRRASFKGWV